MTTRLEVSKKRTPVESGPVLSPKIIQSFARKLRRPSTRFDQDSGVALGLYLQGVMPSRHQASVALRMLKFPLVLLVAELQGASFSVTRECIDVFSDLSRGQYRALHMGDGSICVLVEHEADQTAACSALKKSAQKVGGVLNIGLSEDVSTADGLAGAYRDAVRVARLGLQLWGKPYVYRQSDMGLVLALVEGETMYARAQKESVDILASLARPKVLLPTLRLFFACNMSPTEVARVGRVHRNTVVYRLEKIRQLTNFDPLDFNDATQLYLALTMYDMAQMNVGSVALAEGATLSDQAVTKILGGSGINDARAKRLIGTAGVSLAGEFSVYVVQGSQDLEDVAISTTTMAKFKLSASSWLIIDSSSSRQAAKVAAQLSVYGRVTYLASSQIVGQLSSALLVLISGQAIAAQRWPELGVVPLDAYGGLLAFMGNNRTREFAHGRAVAIIEKLRGFKQLELTTGVLLETSLNLTAAARRLKVHRNTLIYRVGRIKQLTGYDLTKFEDAVQMRLAFLLAELT